MVVSARAAPRRRARRRRSRILCLGAHSDDIEIGCGGTLLRLLAERPGLDGALGRAVGDARARARGARERRPTSSPTPAARDGRRSSGSARATSRTSAPRSRTSSKRLKRTCRPDVGPHPPPRRRAPGPPHDRRADLEHVPQPPDRRVRDPQVRGRPRHTPTCSCRSPRPSPSARSSSSCEHFASQARQALVPAGDVRGRDGAARRRVQRARRLRRGIPRPQAGRLMQRRQRRGDDMKVLVTGHRRLHRRRDGAGAARRRATTSSASTPGSTTSATSSSPPDDVPTLDVDLRDVTRGAPRAASTPSSTSAALSNDPLGDLNPSLTYDINLHASVRLAEAAKEAGRRALPVLVVVQPLRRRRRRACSTRPPPSTR